MMTADEVLANKPFTYFFIDNIFGHWVVLIALIALLFVIVGRLKLKTKFVFISSGIIVVVIIWVPHSIMDDYWQEDINSYIATLSSQEAEIIDVDDITFNDSEKAYTKTVFYDKQNFHKLKANIEMDLKKGKTPYVTFKYDKHDFQGKYRDVVLHVNTSYLEKSGISVEQEFEAL